MKVILSIYNFIVGDMIILIGVLLTVALMALINTVSALAPLRAVSGAILIIVVLAVLVASLSREAFARR